MDKRKIIEDCQYKMNLPFNKLAVILEACIYFENRIKEGKVKFSSFKTYNDEVNKIILDTLKEIKEELLPQRERMHKLIESLTDKTMNIYNSDVKQNNEIKIGRIKKYLIRIKEHIINNYTGYGYFIYLCICILGLILCFHAAKTDKENFCKMYAEINNKPFLYKNRIGCFVKNNNEWEYVETK